MAPPVVSKRRMSSRAISKVSTDTQPLKPNRISFLSLPIEILHQIINNVAGLTRSERSAISHRRAVRGRIVTEEIYAYLTFLDEKTPILNSLQSLGSVNRKLFELCRSLLWKRVHMPTFWPIPISFYTDHILARNGSFVQSLAMDLSSECANGPKPSTRLKTARSLLDNTEIIARRNSNGVVTPACEFLQRPRELISAESAKKIVALCPNLRNLVMRLPAVDPRGRASARMKANLESFLLALLSHLPRLEKLDIDRTWPLRMPELSMSRVVSQLPFLQSLCLSHLTASPHKSGSDCLGWQLSRLQHLVHLKLCRVDGVHESWIDYSWSQSIKELRMEQCNTLSPAHTYQLISAMAPKLVRLKIGYGDIEPVAMPDAQHVGASWAEHRFDLPDLTDLTIDIYSSFDVTSCFSKCRSLERLKYDNLGDVEWEALNKLLPQPTWPHLKSIDVCRGALYFFRRPDADAFSEQCEKLGIKICVNRSDKRTNPDWDEYHEFLPGARCHSDILSDIDSMDEHDGIFPAWLNDFVGAEDEDWDSASDSDYRLSPILGLDVPFVLNEYVDLHPPFM